MAGLVAQQRRPPGDLVRAQSGQYDIADGERKRGWHRQLVVDREQQPSGTVADLGATAQCHPQSEQRRAIEGVDGRPQPFGGSHRTSVVAL